MAEDIEQELAEKIEDGVFNSGNDNDGLAKAIVQVIDRLKLNRDMDLFTRLSEEDVAHLSIIDMMDRDVSKQLADNYKRLKVSENSYGRKNMVKIVESLGVLNQQGNETKKEKVMAMLQ